MSLERVFCYVRILGVIPFDIIDFGLLHARSETLADEQFLEVLLLIHLVTDIIWSNIDVGEIIIIGD
jgi:hypothetical protein